MAIVTWDPTRDLSLLQGDMNRLFERFFGAPSTEARTQRWMPAMDVAEEGEHFVLRLDLPGMAREDVTIELDERALRISGERRFVRKPEHDGGFVRLERPHGRFEREITIPEGVDADAIEATFEHGVLELRVPKPVAVQPRRIEIGGGTSRRVVEAEASETG